MLQLAVGEAEVEHLVEHFQCKGGVSGTASQAGAKGYALLEITDPGESTFEIRCRVTPRWIAANRNVRADAGKVSLMFGCERTGLTNEELEVCHYHVTIPANPEYSSLNLAMAVQVLTYEIRQAYLKYLGMDPMKEEIVHTSEKYLDKEQPASGDEIIGFHQHLEEVLLLTGFLHENNRGSIMRKIKRIFSRPYLTRDDVNILRGILSSVTRTLGKINE